MTEIVMAHPWLDAVANAAQLREEADRMLYQALREAAENGESLRAIAEVCGVSHETVRRMISVDQT